jgi:hypothetical protein
MLTVEGQMEPRSYELYQSLQRRRGEVVRTLEHVRRERATLEHNQAVMNKAAYQNRLRLFEDLTAWYAAERARIERALSRIGKDSTVPVRTPRE